MHPLIVPSSCVEATTVCYDTASFVFGWPQLVLAVVVLAFVETGVAVTVRASRQARNRGRRKGPTADGRPSAD